MKAPNKEITLTLTKSDIWFLLYAAKRYNALLTLGGASEEMQNKRNDLLIKLYELVKE